MLPWEIMSRVSKKQHTREVPLTSDEPSLLGINKFDISKQMSQSSANAA